MVYNYPHFPTKSYRSYPHGLNNRPFCSKNMPNRMGKFPTESNIPTHNNKEHSKKLEDKKIEGTYFEILGIKLHSDDILLLCLIFFLYKEGVQDEYLFIALIMLLLS